MPSARILTSPHSRHHPRPQIQEAKEPRHKRLKHTKNDYFVVFYGEGSFQWVPPKGVQAFTFEYDKRAKAKTAGLQGAVDEAWAALGQPRPDVGP